MPKKKSLQIWCVMKYLFVLAWLLVSNLAHADDRPNILLIFADDLGWSDLGCYGSKRFSTPHLDQLAAQGMRFTQAYAAAPICSASRASLLTGNSTARNRFEFVVKTAPGRQKIPAPLRAPPFTINLSLDSVTIAEALAKRGYRTGFSAIRRGNWKLIHFYENDKDELYDLSRDPSESKNLANRHPTETKALREQLRSYLKKVKARFPTANPKFTR